MQLTDEQLLVFAKFMGATVEKSEHIDGHYKGVFWTLLNKTWTCSGSDEQWCWDNAITSWRYNFESWGWIMAVVEKVEKCKYLDEFTVNYCSVYKHYTVEITNAEKETFEIIRKTGDDKKALVIEALLDFITWHNSLNFTGGTI